MWTIQWPSTAWRWEGGFQRNPSNFAEEGRGAQLVGFMGASWTILTNITNFPIENHGSDINHSKIMNLYISLWHWIPQILQFSKITSSSRPAQVELMLQLADDKRLGSCVRYNCWVDSREDSTRLYHETLGIWVDITQKMMIRWWLEGCTTQYIGIVTIHWESLLTNHYDYHWNDMYRILRDFTQLLGIWTSKNGRAGYVW